MLLPEIEGQQKAGKEVVFRADAAFAKPEIGEALEERGVKPGSLLVKHARNSRRYRRRPARVRQRRRSEPGERGRERRGVRGIV
jgi:hypothetical protein